MRLRAILTVGLLLGVCSRSLAVERQRIAGQRLRPEAQVQPVGRLAATNRLKLAIGLPWVDPEGLTNLLRDLYDPAHPQFRHFLTPDQFTQRFGPSEADYQSLKQFAAAKGLVVTATHSNRLLLNVEGDVATVERALGVTFRLYPHPTEFRTFFAADAEPSLELSTRVLHISGLDNFSLPRPRSLRPASGASPVRSATGGVPRAGSGPTATFIGNDFRSAYLPGTTLNGQGQSVGLFELDGYYASDITAYATLAGITKVPLKNVLIDGFNGIPAGRSTGSANEEVALDIEVTMSMAPGLSQLLVYEASPDATGASIDHLLNRMATDNLARQLSCSWGFDADIISQQIFQEYAAQGQSYFLASGDNGAFVGPVEQASDNPYITIVGGTSLTTDGLKKWSSETTWSGSGGGISTLYPLPEWQQGIDMTLNRGSTVFRNIPDVAMVADNVWAIADKGKGAAFQGTSIAAPLWAGLMALANEQAAAKGQQPVGFLNPAVYRIGRDPRTAAVFHDITTGNNASTGSAGLFSATRGYDLCTGWGTPRGTDFINALLALAPADSLQITPPLGLFVVEPVRDGFGVKEQTYTLSNTSSTTVHWAVRNLPSWLLATSTGGTLTPGGPAATVTLSLNPDDTGLLLGSRSASVAFVNLDTGSVQERPMTDDRRNGGFETGDYDGWTLNGSTDNNFVDSIDTSLLLGSSTIPGIDDSQFVHSGIFGMFLGENTALGSLSQTLPTLPGELYSLSFYWNNPAEGTPNQFRASWNGTVLLDQSDVGVMPWTLASFVVPATGTQTDLTFEFRNDDNAFGLDDIRVERVAAAVLGIQSATPTQVVLAWNAVPGLNYQLQYTDDLGVANWIAAGDPAVATDPAMTSTVKPGGGTQRFYRVVLIQ